MLLQKIQTLKDESKMSYQEIADKSGVPLSTVKRIFSGQTPDPGYTSVIAIIEAMGGSGEDLKADSEPEPSPAHKPADFVSRQSVERLCAVYEKSLKDKRKLIVALLTIVLTMTAIFIFLLIWDLLSPDIGFFRR